MVERTPKIATIVLAGGSGTRLGLAHDANKVYLPLEGRPLLAWSLQALYEGLHPVTTVVVVRSGDEPDAVRACEVAGVPAPRVVCGGATRTASEVAGILAISDLITAAAVDIVLVHDGARPFPPPELLERLVAAAATHVAAVPVLAVEPGLAHREHGAGALVGEVDTSGLGAVQTPQAFSAVPLLAAATAAAAAGTDTVDTLSLFTLHGGPSAVVVAGDPRNLKVTHPADLDRAAAIARDLGQP